MPTKYDNLEEWQASLDLEMAMKLPFMTGLPNDIFMELQQAPAIETLAMGDLLTWVKVLTRYMAKDTVAAMQLPQSVFGVLEANPQTGITCYRCRDQGYITRDCAMRWPAETSAKRCDA